MSYVTAISERDIMDISSLTNGKPLQVWLPFGDDSEVLIEYVSREDLLRLNEKARTTSYRNGQKTEFFDPVLADKLLGRRVVKNWKGFVDHGNEFPCTPENTDILMAKWNEFARFVNESCVSLETLVAKEKELISKNSLNTSGQG